MLGIETSCDETGVALVDNGKVIAANVATQQVHSRWGGVVPELASRLHQVTLAKMVNEILEDTGWKFSDLEGVAVTRGPGLIGALLVGVSYAKGLAVGLDIPFKGVNHLEGHLWAAVAAGEDVPFPTLALLVSGGHTELIQIDKFEKYRFLGGTLDDAAGEAFDKVGGLLGIPYPAGPEFARMADEGNASFIDFPVADTKRPLDFSFSGLKTAASREIAKLKDRGNTEWQKDIAASYQKAAIKQITIRLKSALKNYKYEGLLLAGGVAANKKLRAEVDKITAKNRVKLIIPPVEWCTDNGAMIAYLGERLLEEHGGDSLDIETDPNLQLVWHEEFS